MKTIDLRRNTSVRVTNGPDDPVNITGEGSSVNDSIFAHLTDSELSLGQPGFTGFNTLKIAQETQIFEEGWAKGLDTDEVWDVTETGTGTVVVLDSEGIFATVVAGDEATIQTKLPHQFLHGFSTLWRIAFHTDSLGVRGAGGSQDQKYEFGPHDVDDGYFFRINGGLDCVIRRKTVETVTNIVGFISGRHAYAIQYLDGNQVRFYVDGVLVHSAISGNNNLVAKSNLPTTITNKQDATVGLSIGKAYGLAVIREGAPFVFNSSGELMVSSGRVSTPSGALKVLQPTGDPLVTLSPNQVLDDFYLITNGSTLTVQQLRARVESAGTGKSVRIELFHDPLGVNPAPPSSQPASWIRIDTLMGNNFNQDASQDNVFVGDGTRRIVLRLKQTGSASIAVDGQWQGFEI